MQLRTHSYRTKSKQILMDFMPIFYTHVTMHRNRFLLNN